MLEHIEYISIVGKASSGEEAINLTNELNPDILLMDILMQGMSGIEAARWIKEQNPNVKIILLSSEINEETVTRAVKAGVDGYLPKDTSRRTLLDAIEKVRSEEKYFAQAISNIILEAFYRKETSKHSVTSNELTKRENEVLKLVAFSKTNAEVAEELFISVKTVETHKNNILSKLGLRNTADLVRYAVKNSIIEI